MPLPWTRELMQIVEEAGRDADHIGTKLNSVFLLSSMLKNDGMSKDVLNSLAVSRDSVARVLSEHDLTPEHPSTPRRLYDRATRLATYAQTESVRPEFLLLAMTDEKNCLAHSILEKMGVDIDRLRQIIFGFQKTGTVQCQTAVGRSASITFSLPSSGAASSQFMRRPSVFSMQVAEPQIASDTHTPSACTATHEKALRRGPMSPEEIELITSAVESPATRQSGQFRSIGDAAPLPAARKPSVRESQHATMLDLAQRLLSKSLEMQAIPKKSASTSSSDNDVISHAVATAKDVEEQLSRPSRPPSVADLVANECAEDVDEVSKAALSRATTLPVNAEPVTTRNDISNKTPESFARTASRSIPGHAAIITKKNCHEYARSAQKLETSANTRTSPPLPSGYSPFHLKQACFPVLSQFGRNLLAAARDGKIDPVIDREHEIDQLIDILHKRKSNNPVLVGEPGVGKTAIIEGLAQRMATQTAPRGLENHTIIALDYGAILCGTQLRGAIQERISAIKKEVKASGGLIVLFLDEIHTWLGPNNGDPNSDATTELKLALSRGELKCIGASTPSELRRAFDADPAFARRFDIIEVKAPSVKSSIEIIKNGIIRKYAEHHGVSYSDDAIGNAVRLSDRYIQERALPDKALSVLDRAGSFCVRSGDTEVTTYHVAQIIAQLTEVPVERLLMTEKQKLMNMEALLGERLIGHEKNIAKISQVIRRNQAGFGAQRPIGSFLFLGPTGVGKTEAAKVLADFLFGSRKNICRFDMSEFMEQHSVAKLIGAPAGYVGFDDGGLLTEALRKRPYQIVLFDEIEKAHPDVMNILLQILDEGRLTDAKGRHVDFSNTVVILTSNIGAQEVMDAARKGIGFSGQAGSLTEADAEQIIFKAARARFTPELYNRIEEKLIFHPLTREQIERIASLLLNDSRQRLFDDKHIDLEINEDKIIPFLIEHGGFDPMFGARPMRQTIQSLVESRVAEWILSHEDLPSSLVVDLEEDKVTVSEPRLVSWQELTTSV